MRLDRIFFLTDTNVAPLFAWGNDAITVPAGEASKSPEMLLRVVGELEERGATRRSLLVNVGGGMVCDLGGFAAGIFKRGIRHVNVPTTLLAMADAAIGGKTGIDYQGLKNELGLFKMPERVIVDPEWLRTLSPALMADGFAEVVKSAMLGSEDEYSRLLHLPEELTAENVGAAAEWAACFKESVVREDPEEKGVRRILNLGHTAGHAFESASYIAGQGISHGTAVAHGLLVTLLLSCRILGLRYCFAEEYARCVLPRYPRLAPEVPDVERLWQLMGSDKKNFQHGQPAFILLRHIGTPSDLMPVAFADFEKAMELYCRLLMER